MAKINDFNFAGLKAIVRVDFNVPLNEKGEITDDTRIRGAVPTLKKILADGGTLIIMSHMGKPKGKINHKLSLSQITSAVAGALGCTVKFAQDSADAKSQADALKPGEVLLLDRVCQDAGQLRRRICQRCLWHRSPPPCIDRRYRRLL